MGVGDEGDTALVTLEDLTRNSGYLLSTAGRIVRERFERALQPTGLRARHLGVLVTLATLGPLSQGDVAQQGGVDKSTMVAVIDDLEGWGLVERRRSRVDRRAYKLTLTAAGRAKSAEAGTVIAAFGEAQFAPLNVEEQRQLQVLLARLLFGPGGWMVAPERGRPERSVSPETGGGREGME
jgi:DNA-binding MarR family transcriptional regulator